MFVKKPITLEAYNLFKSVYEEWRNNPSLSFQLPEPLKYDPAEKASVKTWLEGKRASVSYFLLPEWLSGYFYGVTPSQYVKEASDFLLWLHSLKPATKHIDSEAIQSRYISWMKGVLDQCRHEDLIDEKNAEKIEEATDIISKLKGWGPISIIHGDFKTQNVLIAKRGLAVIDFESIRQDFSYLDLARFLSNIKLRVSKYRFFKESFINNLTTIFLGHYEETRGEIDKRALGACSLPSLTLELQAILGVYLNKKGISSLPKRISLFLLKRNVNYVLREITPLGTD